MPAEVTPAAKAKGGSDLSLILFGLIAVAALLLAARMTRRALR